MEKPIWVLVVDDEPDVVEAITNLLQSAFPKVKTVVAFNGMEAIQKINMQKFQLVISDVKMEKATGDNLIKMASAVVSDLRPDAFILISGGSPPEVPPNRIGKVTFLPKPINENTLKESVGSILYPEEFKKAAPSAKVDVAFINPFIDATLKVLGTTAGVQATKVKTFVRKNDQISGDISAVISMNSDTFLGSMAISFEQSCFLFAVSNMLGEAHTTISGENQDAAAELCNQIFGQAKVALNEQGHTIQPAIPAVIVGLNHSIHHTANGPCIAVQFSTEKGNFTIEAVVQSR